MNCTQCLYFVWTFTPDEPCSLSLSLYLSFLSSREHQHTTIESFALLLCSGQWVRCICISEPGNVLLSISLCCLDCAHVQLIPSVTGTLLLKSVLLPPQDSVVSEARQWSNSSSSVLFSLLFRPWLTQGKLPQAFLHSFAFKYCGDLELGLLSKHQHAWGVEGK